MKRTLFLIMIMLLCFTLSGCGQTEFTTDEMEEIVLREELHVLTDENSPFRGPDEMPSEFDSVEIIQSKISGNDASADISVSVLGDNFKGNVFYRLDLKKQKGQWNITTKKNHKQTKIVPLSAPSAEMVAEEIEKLYEDKDYNFSFSKIDYDKENYTAKAEFLFESGSEVSESNGIITADFEFSEKTAQWVLGGTNEENVKVTSWHPEGQWRFNDYTYYFKLYINELDLENNTASLKVVASEYESLTDTSPYAYSETVSVTVSEQGIYFDEIEIPLDETRSVKLKLCVRYDNLYFTTNSSNQYKEVNMSRYTSKTV